MSVDEHQLRVIAIDGYLVQPVSTDYIMINSGERYDFLLQALKTVLNFSILEKQAFGSEVKCSLVPSAGDEAKVKCYW